MRRLGVLACSAVLASCSGSADRRDEAPNAGEGPARPNAVVLENRRAGEPGWKKFSLSSSHLIEGYADRVSARPGDEVKVMVSSSVAGSAHWRLFRLGWYGGAGARRLLEGKASVPTQPPCPANPATGLVRCSWTPTFTVAVPHDAVAGLHVFTIVRDDGFGTFVPLVVRDGRRADLLLQASVATDQAYNGFGGESFYQDALGLPFGHAVEVSYDRPYLNGHGAGHLLMWEANFARFLERYGYDVTYTTNLDVSREGVDALRLAGAFLSVGHDEYWTGAERDAVEAARDGGTAALFFGGNAAYWKIRASQPGADGNARVLTCYKSMPRRDPLVGTADRTGVFRGEIIRRPEEALIGAMYEGWMLFPQPWVVADPGHFAFAGTGLQAGSSIPFLVGVEYDRTFGTPTPAPVAVLARSPVVDAGSKPGISESTVYRAPSGALVFDAGTINWPWLLARDPRVQRITANLLEAATGATVPAELAEVHAPAPDKPAVGTWARSVRTLATGLAGPSGLTQLRDGSLLVTDARANQIVRIADGAASVFAGDGRPGSDPAYDNVPAARARFQKPTSLVAGSDGVVYLADTDNSCVRAVLADSNRTVVTFAGAMGAAGFRDDVGTAARFSHPGGLALDPVRGRLLVADRGNDRIRAIDLRTRAVTTVASWRPSARIPDPTAVALAPDGRIFVVSSETVEIDADGGPVKMIRGENGFAIPLTAGGYGFADGEGTFAGLTAQAGILWHDGALYVSDPANRRIRKIIPGKDAATTQVTTFAGSGRLGTDDGAAADASFTLPLGLWKAADGSILVADGAGQIRAVAP